jgi:L-serine dehydratase
VAWNSIAALLDAALEEEESIGETALAAEAKETEKSADELIARMDAQLTVMQQAIERGLHEAVTSRSGLVGGQARQMLRYAEAGHETLSGNTAFLAAMYATATLEVNASMGRIVATPTGGSSGILPGVLLAVAEERQTPRHDVIMALFCAGALGLVIANSAGISGAEGGCQFEVGTATAMAAAAVTQMVGGSPEQVCQAAGLVLKNVLGLVCDPVAGLVEIPCVKRNGLYASLALMASDMALAGIRSVIPADEIIKAMADIGRSMPAALRETAQGGLAVTPTGKMLMQRLSGSFGR